MAALVLLPLCVRAQTSQRGNARADSSSLIVTEQGPNHRVWGRITPLWTNRQGQVTYRTNGGFTELGTGLNHRVGNTWVESAEDIAITTKGGIAAHGQHQVEFAANINTPGSIRLTAPDGKLLASHIIGLSYFDSSANTNVLFAVLQDRIGNVFGNNLVVYTNAFRGANADVKYTYTRGSFEQDIVLREQPPSPASLGLNPQTTQLQVWTEFVNPPAPRLSPGHEGDQTLDFGAMQMGHGRAFMIGGSDSNSVAVTKQWATVRGRSFLVENVPFSSVAAQIEFLPTPSGGGAGKNPGGGVQQIKFEGFPKQMPPVPKLAQATAGGLKFAARPKAVEAGLVMDYVVVNATVTNFTFQSDQTYLINGPLSLYGTTTLEGGAVIKYTNNVSNPASLTVNGSFSCQTSPYRMAVLTSANDNTVGQVLPGSTGTPGEVDFSTYLYLGNGGSISNARFSYAWNAYAMYGPNVDIWDCQFIKCGHPITTVAGNTSMGVHNVLITMDDTINNSANSCGCEPAAITGYATSINLYCENITCDLQSQKFVVYYTGIPTPSNVVITLTNSIVITPYLNPYYHFGGAVGNTVSTNFTLYSSNAITGLFQTVGAGNYYLGTNSTYRDAGTTNVNSNLLARLKTKTTYPPLVTTNAYTTNTTLSPQAGRDADTPDLGYHYDPIDYMSCCSITNATLTLTNGVALAFYKYPGIWLQAGSSLVSQGAPNQRNYLAFYNLAQEQSTNLCGTNSIGGQLTPESSLAILGYSTNGSYPNCTLRFTTLCAPVGADYAFFNGDSGLTMQNLQMRDCEIYSGGGTFNLVHNPTNSTLNLQNNLFNRPRLWLENNATDSAYNNLFTGNTDNFAYLFGDGAATMTNRDNVFDGVDSYVEGAIGYNAYLNGAIIEAVQQGSDIVTNLAWVTGPLGNYYQAANSPLINVGSRAADIAGLYNYTTTTNQGRESYSTVDIGYHYVAVDGGGNLFDPNISGLIITIQNPTNGINVQ